MSDYKTYPAVNSNYEFPPEVQEAISQSAILRQHFAYLNEGVLEVDGQPIDSFATSEQGAKADTALQSSGNLSEIQNSEAARANLDVYSKGEVDGLVGDDASLNQLGTPKAIFLTEGDPLPPGLPDYTMVVRLPE